MRQPDRSRPQTERETEGGERELYDAISRMPVYVQRDADLNARQYYTEDEAFDSSRSQRMCRDAPITRAECDPGT